MAALPTKAPLHQDGNTNGIDVQFDLSLNNMVQGDIVVCYGGRANTSDAQAFGPITAGYTAVPVSAGTNPINSTGPKFGVWYKVMGATPDTVLDLEGGGSTAHGVAYCAYVLDGSAVDPAIFDVNAVSSGQVTEVPNGRSITTVTDGAWVVVHAANSVADASTGVVTGYTRVTGNLGNDTDDITVDAYWVEKVTAGAEDPPAWTTWTSGIGGSIVVAFKPAALQQFDQNVDGAITPAGALAKTTTKVLSGGVTPAGELVKMVIKPLGGAISPAGVALKTTSKVFAGGISPSGEAPKTTTKVLSGAVDFVGDVTAIKTFLKLLDGAVSPAGAVVKTTTKALSGTVEPAGALIRFTTKTLAGALSPAGALLRATTKLLSGDVTPAGGTTAEKLGGEPEPPPPEGRVTWATKSFDGSDIT